MESLLFTLWVTSACNLKCRYCYEGIDKQSEFMNEKVASDSIDFIIRTLKNNQLNSCRVVFHGGEPTLNMPVVKYVIEKFKTEYPNIDVNYGMTTNAYMLSDDTRDYIVNHIDDLTVSLDGVREAHDKNRVDARGYGSFESAFENAVAMNKNSNLRIRMTVNTSNSYKLYENVIFLIEQGFKVIIPGIDYEDKNWKDDHFTELEKQFIDIKKYIEALDTKEIYVSSLSADEISKKLPCDGCVDSYHISAQGLLYPCVYTVGNSEYVYGNVNNGVDYSVFKKFDLINNQDVTECMDCNFYDFCTTKRCKFINKKLTGDYNCPSPVICATENMNLRICGLI